MLTSLPLITQLLKTLQVYKMQILKLHNTKIHLLNSTGLILNISRLNSKSSQGENFLLAYPQEVLEGSLMDGLC